MKKKTKSNKLKNSKNQNLFYDGFYSNKIQNSSYQM